MEIRAVNKYLSNVVKISGQCWKCQLVSFTFCDKILREISFKKVQNLEEL